MTSYSAYWIGQLAKRYNERGPAGMHNRQHTTSRRAARVRSERDGYTTDRPLRDALPSDLMTDVNSDSFTKKLSWAFRHHNGTRFGNEMWRIERAGDDTHAKTARWRVVVGE